MKTSNLNKFSNLKQRVIVAAIGAPIVLLATYFGEWTFFSIFFIICLISQLEFYNLSGLDGMHPLKFWGIFTGIVLFSFSFFIQAGMLDLKFMYLIFPMGAVIFFIKLYKKLESKPFTNIAYTFLGILYVAVPFALLNTLAFIHGQYAYELIFGIMFLIWASDTGAYFIGVRFGRKKLFERVSPNKSWEGFIGGLVTSLLVSLGIAYFFPILPVWQWVIISILAVSAGTYGDLVESLFKRSIFIKDSGGILPGHGGFLDRFDALILAIPFVVAFVKLVN
ncbi:MAG: phosphatidate cytidylyltransferase [Cyclobacteriaceae bacterium]